MSFFEQFFIRLVDVDRDRVLGVTGIEEATGGSHPNRTFHSNSDEMRVECKAVMNNVQRPANQATFDMQNEAEIASVLEMHSSVCANEHLKMGDVCSISEEDYNITEIEVFNDTFVSTSTNISAVPAAAVANAFDSPCDASLSTNVHTVELPSSAKTWFAQSTRSAEDLKGARHRFTSNILEDVLSSSSEVATSPVQNQTVLVRTTDQTTAFALKPYKSVYHEKKPLRWDNSMEEVLALTSRGRVCRMCFVVKQGSRRFELRCAYVRLLYVARYLSVCWDV